MDQLEETGGFHGTGRTKLPRGCARLWLVLTLFPPRSGSRGINFSPAARHSSRTLSSRSFLRRDVDHGTFIFEPYVYIYTFMLIIMISLKVLEN